LFLQPTVWQNVPTKKKETLEQQILETEGLVKNYDSQKSQKGRRARFTHEENLNKTHGIAGCEKIVTALRTYAQGTGKQLKNPLFISILVILK
jgi:hypothetical protein